MLGFNGKYDIYKSIRDYINNVLDYEIVCYKHKYKRNLVWYMSLEIATMLSSVSIPLLTKMAAGWIDTVAIMGSIVTILNGLLSLFNLKSHYLLYKHIYKRLELEKYTFEYGRIPYESVKYSDGYRDAQLMTALNSLQKNVRQIIANGEQIINGVDKSNDRYNRS